MWGERGRTRVARHVSSSNDHHVVARFCQPFGCLQECPVCRHRECPGVERSPRATSSAHLVFPRRQLVLRGKTLVPGQLPLERILHLEGLSNAPRLGNRDRQDEVCRVTSNPLAGSPLCGAHPVEWALPRGRKGCNTKGSEVGALADVTLSLLCPSALGVRSARVLARPPRREGVEISRLVHHQHHEPAA